MSRERAIMRGNARVLGMLASAALLVGAVGVPAGATEDLQPLAGWVR
jgi:hypothetical protein